MGRKGVETDELAVRPLLLGGLYMRKTTFRAGEVFFFRNECSASGRTLVKVRNSISSSN